jgi:hypothetical protein
MFSGQHKGRRADPSTCRGCVNPGAWLGWGDRAAERTGTAPEPPLTGAAEHTLLGITQLTGQVRQADIRVAHVPFGGIAAVRSKNPSRYSRRAASVPKTLSDEELDAMRKSLI